MKEIAPKFHNILPGSWGTHSKVTNFLQRDGTKLRMDLRKFIILLWDKNTYLDLKICRIDFPVPFCF
eukprot:TRINITY_DN247_c1_g5_i2.p1 TRINITY_DN247_c1_g5~~TRINITY_DN247_c1_g5_i2.p1  ORF type:complete len:67 (-),score=4.14 TRINITY_DN247_c1_g5_i2:79-279(-)